MTNYRTHALNTFIRFDAPEYRFVIEHNNDGRGALRVTIQKRLNDVATYVGVFFFSTPANARWFIENACKGWEVRNW